MENTVLEKFHQGRQSLGTFSAIGSPLAVESLRYTGLDYVIVDTEHSPAGIESAAAQIAAAQGAGLTALARANEISRTAVLRLLDVGAQGVVVPCVETVEEVRELVRYAKFAPLGNRGFCPTRDGGWGHAAHAVSISGYMETSNRETLLLPQCETVGCLEHIEPSCGPRRPASAAASSPSSLPAVRQPAASGLPRALTALPWAWTPCSM